MNAMQEKIVAIADECKRICEKYSLRYYLAYGSLLGAVRHKGFIPWDDDMDIIMPRKDYEQFIEICKTELREPYALRTMEEKTYPYYFLKIDDRTTTLLEDSTYTRGYIGGVYLDIFPIDGLPKHKFGRFFYILRMKYLRRRYTIAILDLSWRKYPWYKRLILKLFGHSDGRKYLMKFDRCLRKYDFDTSKLITLSVVHYLPVPKTLFDRCADYSFENRTYRSFADYDTFLATMYGDYMQLPPEEQRVSNHYYQLQLDSPYPALIEKIAAESNAAQKNGQTAGKK